MDSPLFDREWYELQAGRRFASRRRAVEHYVGGGHARFSPHPLFEKVYLSMQGFRPKGADPLSAYLADPGAPEDLSPHPMIDIAAVKQAAGSGGKAAPLERWVAAADADSPLPWGDLWWGDPPALGHLYDSLREVVSESRVQKRLHRGQGVHASLEQAVESCSGAAVSTPAVPGTLVSIIIPTFNRSGRLRAALASVQDQSYPTWEAIVVDEGSEDDTADVVAGVAAFDERVRLLRAPERRVGVSRNRGLAEAKGEFVAFLGPDITWEPDHLATMVAALDEYGWDAAHAICQAGEGEGTVFRTFQGSRDQALASDRVDLEAMVVRRALLEKVGGFDGDLEGGVDYDLVVRLASQTDVQAVPVLGAVRVEDSGLEEQGAGEDSPYWNDVVRNRHLLDWDSARSTSRSTGQVSVILPMRSRATNALSWLKGLAAQARDLADLQVVLVGAGSDLESYRLVAGVVRMLPNGRATRTPRQVSWPIALNLGIAASTGEYLLAVHPRVAPPGNGLVGALVGALRDGAAFAQPVVLDSQGLVSSAGAGFAERFGVPYPLLAGHSPRDVPRGDRVEIPALLSPVFACRAAEVIGLAGVDPLTGGGFTDTELSARGRKDGGLVTFLVPGASVVDEPDANVGLQMDSCHGAGRMRAIHRLPPGGSRRFWREAGFGVSGYGSRRLENGTRSAVTEVQPVPNRYVLEAAREHPPRLRWVIDIAAPAGRGERWGDFHFATSLAAALERLGQHVAIDFREARERPTRSLDDVLLVLRGLDEVRPSPGQVSIQWIISHPELVTESECARFDTVFAAGTTWSQRMTTRWGFPVRTLLQCTDPVLFNPDRGQEDAGAPLLFVGNSRKVERPSVRAALEHGHAVDVYGFEWEEYVPPEWIKAQSVPNAQVGALYASAGVVLNDHWDDMREGGFVSNRLFDAAACGARIVSDDVAGIEDIFGGCIRTFDSGTQLHELLLADPRDVFAPREERLRIAAAIARDHSFDARARQLLDEALRLRDLGGDS